jgi:nucleotide-binding universal stress UspA family protein
MTVAPTNSLPAVWDRVVCGIDGSAASLEAARLVARLMPASAQLTLCAIVNPAGVEGGVLLEQTLTREAEGALDQVQGEIAASHDSEVHLREGPPTRLLVEEAVSERATLLAVGSHGHSRSAGIALGSVATAMLHDAPCSVLIARGTARDYAPRGGEIFVGFDGSGGAHRALGVGRERSERLSLRLRVLVATGDTLPRGPGWLGEELDSQLAVSEDPRTAVEALVAASESAGLLILGSRHLRGVPALSSVSERVAHRASGPVLVVR